MPLLLHDTAPRLLCLSVRGHDGVCATWCPEGEQRSGLRCRHAGPHPAKPAVTVQVEGPDLGSRAGVRTAALDTDAWPLWHKLASALNVGRRGSGTEKRRALDLPVVPWSCASLRSFGASVHGARGGIDALVRIRGGPSPPGPSQVVRLSLDAERAPASTPPESLL